MNRLNAAVLFEVFVTSFTLIACAPSTSAVPGSSEQNSAALASAEPSPCPPKVTVTDLGTLGGVNSGAAAVSTSGEVFGFTDVAGSAESHVFSWTKRGGMVDLGKVGTLGGTYSEVRSVTPRGQIFGRSQLAGDTDISHAFLWTQMHGMVDLGTVGGDNSDAWGVTAQGQVVGWSSTPGNANAHAFSWTHEDGMVDLGTLFGMGDSIARAVNARGEIAGSSAAPVPTGVWLHATLWRPCHSRACGASNGAVPGSPQQDSAGLGSAKTSPKFTILDLGTLGGGYSEAFAVNESGQVVGLSYTTDNAELHGFSWTKAGGIVDLGTLGGTDSDAFLVNARGQVVGRSTLASGLRHAFLWTKEGGMVEIGTPSADWVNPTALNDKGQVVGTYVPIPGTSRAFSWTRKGGFVDLGTLGGVDSGSGGVNARGQVVGGASLPNGASHATLWELKSTPCKHGDCEDDE